MLCGSAEYREDAVSAGDDALVLTMDFSQNLGLPYVSDTPAGWYFLSLIGVSMFGVYSANKQKHSTFLYSEYKGGKGANEVVSMLHRTLELHGAMHNVESESAVTSRPKRLVVWADNCVGQSKNLFVLWYLMLLVDHGVYDEALLKFLVKGHTKNPCDRGFAYARKHLARQDCWTIRGLATSVAQASTALDMICLEDEDHPFGDYKTELSKLYSKLAGIRQYQIFRISSSRRGFVECKRTPTSQVTLVDLRRTKSDLPSLSAFLSSVALLRPRPSNPEKLADIHDKIRSYVPDEFKDDVLYASPTPETLASAHEIKKTRRQAQVKKRRIVDDEC